MIEERKNKLAIVMVAIVAISVTVSMVGVSGQPQQPVLIRGDVIFENETRVPDGWLVNLEDTTDVVYLGNDTTKEFHPVVPYIYEIKVGPSLIIEGHELKAWVRNGDWYGEVTHIVQSGENDPAIPLMIDDIIVFTNTPPNATVEIPSGKQCGDIMINYTLFDADSDTCSIEVEFKGGSYTTWTTATVSGQTTGLTSSPGGVLHSITWLSTADIPGEDDMFQIRITPSDSESTGEAGTTSDFEVDNKAPTIVLIPPTPDDGEEVTENYVVINVSISDADVANVWLNWNEAIIPPSPTGTGGGGGSGAGIINYILFATGNVTGMSTEYIYTFNVTNLTNGEYTYKVFANDTTTCGNLGSSETRNVIINATRTFELPLVEGWNLISIPLELADTSLNAVFPDASDGDLLEAYDGGWLISTYYSAIPGWAGDFENIELDKGYWYNANTAYTATTIEGTEAGPRSVPINAGWNLIGYTRLTNASLNDLIPNASDGDLLEAYDGGWLISTYYSAIPGWAGDFDTIQPGEGYWYQANTPFTWEY